jgi:Histidine kinase-like ATPase domain
VGQCDGHHKVSTSPGPAAIDAEPRAIRGRALQRAKAPRSWLGAMPGGRFEARPIELERKGATLVARIEDTGSKFDPTQFPALSMAKSLEDAKVGDYGIHLMRSFASGMHYERREGRNRLTLRFGGLD